jgi:hypothetical protein
VFVDLSTGKCVGKWLSIVSQIRALSSPDIEQTRRSTCLFLAMLIAESGW